MSVTFGSFEIPGFQNNLLKAKRHFNFFTAKGGNLIFLFEHHSTEDP